MFFAVSWLSVSIQSIFFLPSVPNYGFDRTPLPASTTSSPICCALSGTPFPECSSIPPWNVSLQLRGGGSTPLVHAVCTLFISFFLSWYMKEDMYMLPCVWGLACNWPAPRGFLWLSKIPPVCLCGRGFVYSRVGPWPTGNLLFRGGTRAVT